MKKVYCEKCKFYGYGRGHNMYKGCHAYKQYLICIEDLKYKLVSLDKLLGGIFKTQPE